MNLSVLLPIIIRDGIPAAMRIWQHLESKMDVTQELWDELEQLSEKTYDDYIAEARQRAARFLTPPE